MAQLKWFTWLAIIVIVVSMHRKHSQNKLYGISQPEMTAVKDSFPSDSSAESIDEEHIKNMAIFKLIQYYKTHFIDKVNGSFVYIYSIPDTTISMDVEYGYLISRNIKHLIVTTAQNGQISSYILSPESSDPILLHVKNLDVSDWLKDINGDNDLDFYLKDDTKSSVRLFNAENNCFEKEMTFTSACFSPAEKLVRGTFSDMPVYFKYRWEGLELKPVEFLYPHPENANWLIKSDMLYDDYTKAIGTTLWYLPKDYRTLAECTARGGI